MKEDPRSSMQDSRSLSGILWGTRKYNLNNRYPIVRPATPEAQTNAQSSEPQTLFKLPDEIQLLIVDQFDLTESKDVNSLKSLSQTCKKLNGIVNDSVRLKKSFENYLPIERKILNNFSWQGLGDAAEYANYADHCRYLVREVIAPMVRTCPELYNLPTAGWDQIFSVGLLLRAKMMGFKQRDPKHPRWAKQGDLQDSQGDLQDAWSADRDMTVTSDSFSPVEKLVLFYSALLWQQTYATLTKPHSFQRDEILKWADELVDDTDPGDIWLWGLRSTFFMEGPLALLRMWYGWERPGSAFGFPASFIDPQKMHQMMVERQEMWITTFQAVPRKFPSFWLEDEVEEKIPMWKEQLSIDKPRSFTRLRLEEEAAKSLIACLDIWCALPQDELPWYYND
ncbi:hypothetical protein PMZ80_000622 [Knufia obscura]|uniref:F-box domain-containing protein n=1 Tax=Knufia obscura TaxID=1635080 RepID=A0ABR0S2A1_9EURO|nr:hypothetical protein PMZ80_000622 [Knufia obscura]